MASFLAKAEIQSGLAVVVFPCWRSSLWLTNYTGRSVIHGNIYACVRQNVKLCDCNPCSVITGGALYFLTLWFLHCSPKK